VRPPTGSAFTPDSPYDFINRQTKATALRSWQLLLLDTLIEAIAGRDKAEAVGRDLGLSHWDARHDSDAFQFTRPFALTAIRNTRAFWNQEPLGIELVSRR
jgi:hypothetical protein